MSLCQRCCAHSPSVGLAYLADCERCRVSPKPVLSPELPAQSLCSPGVIARDRLAGSLVAIGISETLLQSPLASEVGDISVPVIYFLLLTLRLGKKTNTTYESSEEDQRN